MSAQFTLRSLTVLLAATATIGFGAQAVSAASNDQSSAVCSNPSNAGGHHTDSGDPGQSGGSGQGKGKDCPAPTATGSGSSSQAAPPTGSASADQATEPQAGTSGPTTAKQSHTTPDDNFPPVCTNPSNAGGHHTDKGDPGHSGGPGNGTGKDCSPASRPSPTPAPSHSPSPAPSPTPTSGGAPSPGPVSAVQGITAPVPATGAGFGLAAIVSGLLAMGGAAAVGVARTVKRRR